MILAVFDRIRVLENQVKGLLPLPEPIQQTLDEKFQLEFNYNSNHIEGNTLTYEETKLLLLKDLTSTLSEHSFREYEEMKAHDAAVKLIQAMAKQRAERPLTEQDIKILHELMLVKPYWKEAQTPDGQPTRRKINVGDYKSFPNHVRLENGEVFQYASHRDTPILMGELMEWYRLELRKAELHPVALAALVHYKFVRIHPFDDGNGRMARLLMNYVLYCFDLPPVIIKSADKRNYLIALQKADSGDLEAFVAYVADQLVWSLQLVLDAAEGRLDPSDDLEKRIELLRRKVKAEERLVKEKSAKLLEESVLPEISTFLQQLDESLQSSQELFVSVSIRREFEYLTNSGSTILKAEFTGFADLIEKIKEGSEAPFSIIEDQLYFEKVDYFLNFDGLRNTDGLGFSFPFHFRFDRFVYTVFFEGAGELRLGYEHPGNVHQLTGFSDKIRKHIQNTILRGVDEP